MLNATGVFGNVADKAPWQLKPSTRGTSDILTSCLVTLSLCAWSAIHVNVEPDEEEFGPHKVEPKSWMSRAWKYLGAFFLALASKATWRKVGWFVAAVLAPELVCARSISEINASQRL
jgi:hypothetical protein